ncbi:MAG: hypothetical protein GEU88_08370 [Solirubrobacterales bacterium]|nr:hypothetical protein [Solirubrobacterales bacterium]
MTETDRGGEQDLTEGRMASLGYDVTTSVATSASDEMKLRFAHAVGHRRVKNELPAVLRETVERGLAVPITNRGEVDAYLVPPEAREALERAERLREAIPLLMAAAAAGAAVPSQTLRELGIEIPFDWRALNRFTAGTAVTFTEGEAGEPWAVAPTALPEPVLEDESELGL